MSSATYDLFSWKCFLLVCKYGSVRQAAKELQLEPSTVSRRIGSLSESLGAPLFEQRGRLLYLTDAGKRAQRNFAPLVKSLETVLALSGGERFAPAHRIHLVAPSGYTMAIVRHVVANFQKIYPDTQFWLETGRYGDENFESLGNGIDLIISTIARENAFFVRREISKHRTFCFASPQYLRAHPVSHPKDLYRRRLGGNTQFITNQYFENEDTGEKVELPLDFHVMGDNTYVLLEWAASGNGILVGCPYTTSIDFIRKGALAVVLPNWRMLDNHVYAYAAKRDLAAPDNLLGVFMDLLKTGSDTLEAAADMVFGLDGKQTSRGKSVLARESEQKLGAK